MKDISFNLLITLFIFWLILIPSLTLQSILFGLITCILITWYSKDISLTKEERLINSLNKIKIFFKFIIYLLIDIFKANIEVSLIVLNPNLPVSPKFIKVPNNFKNDINKVIYANSVTLTPGTLTVDIDEDYFTIHVLTESSAKNIMEKSNFELCLYELEGDKKWL